ncbi:PIN domain-containing protein [Sphingopyxis macrogoltabida]|uniref:PIN domain-containing protein n=1 Tax=Sphingopyxis macrogoltabida TaxID=33050 RepID=A0AAC9FGS3_SPHMC|nr:PIN domain-containing protein [Sphingopyxis macrogoltabida]ALJ15598.1 hypothetical protein LH19_22215 [Sphingopyxis macrogoltabida]AMU91838.1 hypothetical protein ATM17_22765 [Sphingopyxis macrogoltabida]
MPVFLDTNILIYAFSDDPRTSTAEKLLSDGGEISVQVLNEFSNVARKKLQFDWQHLGEALGIVRGLASRVNPLNVETYIEGIALAERYGISIYDGLIVASAIQAGCDILYSEDMHDGLGIGEQLRIVNPF